MYKDEKNEILRSSISPSRPRHLTFVRFSQTQKSPRKAGFVDGLVDLTQCVDVTTE